MFLKRKEINMAELKVGERVTTTLEVVEQGETCEGCFFADKEGCPYLCFKDMRSEEKMLYLEELRSKAYEWIIINYRNEN